MEDSWRISLVPAAANLNGQVKIAASAILQHCATPTEFVVHRRCLMLLHFGNQPFLAYVLLTSMVTIVIRIVTQSPHVVGAVSVQKMANLVSALKEKWERIVLVMRHPILAQEMENVWIQFVFVVTDFWAVIAASNALHQQIAQAMVLVTETEHVHAT
jgi:hypothetical protein